MIDNLLPVLLLQDILFSLFTQEWDWVPAKVINGGKGKGGVGGETVIDQHSKWRCSQSLYVIENSTTVIMRVRLLLRLDYTV